MGMYGHALWPEADTSIVFFKLLMEKMPPVMAGLMVACICAAVMSTCDGGLIAGSANMQQRKDSPLNNREFCAQQGISEKSYYYWLKKLRESAMERGIPQLVALEDREKPDELRIEYHGASMALPGHVDIDAVAAVLRSLQQT